MVKVSVIIPMHNVENYIEECLQSVINQTLTDIEIICVDDGSTDNSLEVLNKYKNLKNLIVMEQNNLGVARTRNNAINCATGEYIAFMDADDRYPSIDVLEELYKKARENNVLICGGSYSQLRGDKIVKKSRGELSHFKSEEFINYKDCQFSLGFYRFIYNRKMIVDNGIYFPDYSFFEDPPFLVHAMIVAKHFYAITNDVYYHRIGHQHRMFDKSLIIDMLSGMFDILELTNKADLAKLHVNIIDILFNSYYSFICMYIFLCSEVMSKFIKIKNILRKEYFVAEHRLELWESISIESIMEYKMNADLENKKFNEFLNKYETIMIFGAGKVGIMVEKYIENIYPNKVSNFLVSDNFNCNTKINNKYINSIYNVADNSKDVLILLAVHNNLVKEMLDILVELNIENYYIVDYQTFLLV